ncbi:MAG: biotin--[Lachnospiraceae bacterium]|nr:biotin--[acetyl-CoA-carboxylase] ligase [Lachnospiraceae bacterium]
MTNDPISLIYKESIDSTNLEARRILDTFRSNAGTGAELKDSCTEGVDSLSANRPFIVVAREQTAGRGRQGKSFYSPKGSGIYMTIALPTGEIPSGVVTLTCRVGIAVSKAIDAEFGCHTGIKWVNDIFLAGRKICGILCEAVSGEGGKPSHILIGIGINISTEEFPDDIKNSAGSVISGQTESKRTLMTKEFVQTLSIRIYESVIKHLDPSYNPIADYKERSVVLGHDVIFYENGVAHSAHAVDIDEAGGLVVRLADTNELKTLTSGEISLRVCE